MNDPYRVVTETLAGTDARVTSFHFHLGGNLYAFSYEREGATRHTLVDAGDPRHQDRILSILTENGVDPAGIDRIIITHRHVDHSGLAALLAGASKADILVHRGFRSFVEGEMAPQERIWFGGFDISELKNRNIVYLSQADQNESVTISGIDFPNLIDPISLGGAGRLHILGCPESSVTHAPDQLIVLYSARSDPFCQTDNMAGLLPTDDVVFAGDLWLMQGPFHHLGIKDIPRLVKFRMRRLRPAGRRNHREQDAAAKEALKRFFCLVRVKPGHGDEFIGSRIIPRGILADRDLLAGLGYEPSVGISVLRTKEAAVQVTAIKERAYNSFVTEVCLWLELGYTAEEASEFLVRICREQSGGTRDVRKDRKQRRARLKAALSRLKNDVTKDGRVRRLAESSLAAMTRFR